MRLAYYTDCDLENDDGPAVNESEFLFQLKREYANNFIFITTRQNEAFCKKHNIINAYFFDSLKLSSFIQKIQYFKLAKKLSRENFDLLVCRMIDIPILPALIKLIAKDKKIAIKTAAIWYVDDIKTESLTDKLYLIIRNLFFRYMYRVADVIDTALPYAKEQFVKEKIVVDKERIFLIENGINTEKFSISDQPSLTSFKDVWPVLGFMGSLPSERGAKQIYEVAKRVIKTYPNIGVIILGDDKELSTIVENLKKIGVKILAPGKVSYASIEKYVHAMTIGFSFYEDNSVILHGNASQKVRQYLACGKPVFSIFHNHQFIIDHGLGMIFDPTDYDMMAKETIKWVNNIERDKQKISLHLRKYALRYFSVESTFKKRLEIYKNIWKRKDDRR